jgi:opacity protein-like surface antigen
MKNFIVVSGLLFLLSLPAYSQIKLGIKAGGNLATMEYENSFGIIHKNRVGFHFGGVAEKDIGQRAFIRSELFHSRKGNKIHSINGSFLNDSDYLNVPLLLCYRPLSGFSLYFGPEVGYALGKSKDAGNNHRDFDFGLDGGMLFNLTKALSLDLRYTYGLVKMVNIKSVADGDPIYDGKNRVAQLGLNYLFLKR